MNASAARTRREDATPHTVHALIGSLIVVGVLTSLLSVGPVGTWWLIVPFAVALTVGETLQVEFKYGLDVRAVDLFEAVLAPVLLVFAGPVAVVLAVASKALSQHRLRIERIKAVFNVAQWAAAVGVASVVYRSLAGDRAGDTSTVPALVVALLGFALTNELAMALVHALAGRAPLRRVVADLTPEYAPHALIWSVNAALGVLFAIAVAASPAASFLLLAPLAFLRWSHQAFLSMRADRTRLDGLAHAVADLAIPIDPSEALAGFVDDVRSAFSASSVELVRFDQPTVISSGEEAIHEALSILLARLLLVDARVRRVRSTDKDSHVAAALLAAGHRDVLAAPLLRDGRVFGALLSYDRVGFEGFEEGEEAVMAAMAAAVSRAIEKSELLGAVVEERRNLAEIVERSSDGIFTVSAAGSIESWNPAMEEMTGVDAASILGTVGSLSRLRLRDADGTPVQLERWPDAGIPPDVLITGPAGEERWLACASAVGTDGQTLVVVARDVTRAREVEQMKDDFIATVSHELRTPLATIRGFTELLEPPGTVSAEVQVEALGRIRRGTARLERLVANLLEVSRIEARQSVDVLPADLDLHDLVGRVVEEVRESWPDRQIDVDLGPGPCRASGSALSTERILINLLSNALTYADQGSILLKVRCGDDGVAISVRDHGPGIPPHDQERIFERFERLDTERRKAGTGLGLYISRGLARTMGAELTVQSQPGQGAEFTLHLPSRAPTWDEALLHR